MKLIKNLKDYYIRDLGAVTNYFGIEITKMKNECLELNQRMKIEEIIPKFQMKEEKPTYLLMNNNYQKSRSQEESLPDNTEFRKAMEVLLYIAIIT